MIRLCNSNMSEDRRPTSVTILAVFVLGLALWNGLRLIQAIGFWSIIKEYHSEPGPLYIAICGGSWFLVGLLITWGLWQRRTWAWFCAIGGTIGYGFWYWFDRLVFQKPHSNWPFALVSTIVFLLWASIMIRRDVIQFFFQKSPSITHLFQSRFKSTKIAPNEKNK
jgi:UDP-N-acetylmuramyl pentapeptide phosphotransferase/UDP-N-acetylglucosamine-1-phosphate transferase